MYLRVSRLRCVLVRCSILLIILLFLLEIRIFVKNTISSTTTTNPIEISFWEKLNDQDKLLTNEKKIELIEKYRKKYDLNWTNIFHNIYRRKIEKLYQKDMKNDYKYIIMENMTNISQKTFVFQQPKFCSSKLIFHPQFNDEENEAPVNESSSGVLQTADGDEFPGDYVDPSEASEEAYDEYVRNLKANNEKRSENNTLYRLPSTADQQESCVAYCQQQQQQPPTYSTKKKNSEIRRNEFDTWIRNATDKEREQAMKMLNAVVNRPIMGYDIPKKPQPVLFKPSPVITPGRTASNSRQLGQARNHQRVPCDICEKQLIKHHIWSLSRSTSLNCPHQD
ncbi:unnamed protein product [Adineta steineri]|uniref:Uncharacterized protein n=1 Tax=Adineta steineri TaxID=433720 RepID=A0A814W8S6_9BILA|nr:unnamed protein product [Adineta steineri]